MEYTLRSLASLDVPPGVDLIWIDGSRSASAKALPHAHRFQYCRLVEAHELGGGPDPAIRLGLERMVVLGYDLCGLLENDVVLAPGWYERLLKLFSDAREEGYDVGAATVRNVKSRVLLFRPHYTVNWAIGAGMVLFSRQAVKIILATYGAMSARKLADRFKKKFSVDLGDRWELWMDRHDRPLGCDWTYAIRLLEHGLISVGSIPSMARNIDMDMEKEFKTTFVTHGERTTMLTLPRIGIGPRIRLFLLDDRLRLPLYRLLKNLSVVQMNLVNVARKFSRLLRRLLGPMVAFFPKPRL